MEAQIRGVETAMPYSPAAGYIIDIVDPKQAQEYNRLVKNLLGTLVPANVTLTTGLDASGEQSSTGELFSQID